MLFTARWSQGLYDFAVGYLRYSTRLTAYLYYATDAYPPFSGREDDAYPVRVHVAPPLAQYNRVKVFFRFFYAYLALGIRAGLRGGMFWAAIFSWFSIVFAGRQARSLKDVIGLSLSYGARASALVDLVTETYPLIAETVPSGLAAAAPPAPAT